MCGVNGGLMTGCMQRTYLNQKNLKGEFCKDKHFFIFNIFCYFYEVLMH